MLGECLLGKVGHYLRGGEGAQTFAVFKILRIDKKKRRLDEKVDKMERAIAPGSYSSASSFISNQATSGDD